MDPSLPQTFQFNRLPRIDPEKEKTLLQFLGKPIDSREAVQTPNFSAAAKVPSNVPAIPLKQPPPTVVSMEGTSKEVLTKEWEKRFSRFSVNPHDHGYCSRSFSSQSYYPSLVQRQQVKLQQDPLNVLSIEEISHMRHHQVQGPTQQLSHLPQLRCVPADLMGRKLKRK